jgi:hypothetical protein
MSRVHTNESVEGELYLWVRRQPSDYQIAKFPIAALHGLHWDNSSGGVGTRTSTFLYGYVFCNEQIDGELGHSCLHGEGPHDIKVCVLKIDNPKLFSQLVEIVGPKPKPSPSCRQDAIRIIKQKRQISRSMLVRLLKDLHHGDMTINVLLTKMEKRGIIISRREGRLKIFRIGELPKVSRS